MDNFNVLDEKILELMSVDEWVTIGSITDKLTHWWQYSNEEEHFEENVLIIFKNINTHFVALRFGVLLNENKIEAAKMTDNNGDLIFIFKLVV